MKKFFGIIMIITWLLLLAACGSESDSASSNMSVQRSTEDAGDTMAAYGDSSETDDVTGSNDIGQDDSTDSYDTSQDDGFMYESQNPDVVSLRNQTFNSVSPFSEGRAWVQYWDDALNPVTAVINIAGEIVFIPEQKVIDFLPYKDGYAVYLYMIDPLQGSTIDNVRSCIVDSEGNITYDSAADGKRAVFAYGGGHFLCVEHVADFDTNEWHMGSVDPNGNTLIEFAAYDGVNDTHPNYLMNNSAYLGEGIFKIRNALFSSDISSDFYRMKDGSKIKGMFQNGCALIYLEALLSDGYGVLTSTGEGTILNTRDLPTSDPALSDYADGLFFFKDQYYDIEGVSQISFPQYEGKRFRGGTFHDGYAPMYIEGADENDYFTIIDLQGNVLFGPLPGYPADSLNEGCLVVQSDSGSAVYDINGQKIVESDYDVSGGIGQDSAKVTDGYYVACPADKKIPTVFVGIDGSIIGQ